jgi:cellulase
MVYASKAGSSLSWTKLWEDTFDGKLWAVDKLIAGTYTGKKGQHNMKIPAGLAPGEYLFRPEIAALHEGMDIGKTQFYMECVHVTVGGSGSTQLPAGVSFPGAYAATDAGVHFDIYKGATTYPPIGPKVWNGASSGTTPSAPATTPAVSAKPVTTSAPAAVSSAAAVKTTLATVARPAATPAPASGSVQKWGQCGGQGYTGATTCASSTCTKQNDYYYQCL